MKEIFLKNLPRWKEGSKVKLGTINWRESIKYKVHFIYEDIEGDVEIVDYERNRKHYLTITYNDSDEFEIHTDSFRKCCLGKLLKKRKSFKFKYNIGDFIPNKNVKIIDRKDEIKNNNLYKYYLLECQDCKYTYWVLETNMIKKYGTNCSKCSDGIKYPNKFMFNMLEQLQMDFKKEYSPEWIGRKSYDFYFGVNDKKYIIEMDGQFHENDNKMNGQTKEESKEMDTYKDDLAEEHGIEVIRIDCNYGNNNRFEYIKNNILKNEKLNELFDLNKIDWGKCDLFAGSSSLLLEACRIKRNNPNLSPKEISKIMGNISTSPVISYLNFGHTHGLCEYNAKEEHLKSNRANAENSRQILSKAIICLDNEKTFDSVIECDRQSLNIFGVHLDYRNISAVCNEKRNHTRGYHFKFIKDLTSEELIKYKIK